MTALREWILSLCGVAVISIIALSLTPKGRVRGVTRLVCGLVMIIALIKPFAGFDFNAYSLNLARYREAAGERENDLNDANERLLRTIIEEEYAAYILDKAQVLALEAESVTVTAKWGDDGVWYPHEARVSIRGSEGDKRRLEEIIEAELGIPRERQYWSGEEDGS